MAETDNNLEISLVIPFYNEEGNVLKVISDVNIALNALGKKWEMILVDDGSTDKTLSLLYEAKAHLPNINIIHFPNNKGQGESLYKGFQIARAPLIAMMDGDGQNLASDIGLLISNLNTNDLIVGIRTKREDTSLRKLSSKIANLIRRLVLNDKLHDAGCALKVFRAEVRSSFYNIKMLNPFMPAFALAANFKVTEYPVRHCPRTAGRSKYGFKAMLITPVLELIRVWSIIHIKLK